MKKLLIIAALLIGGFSYGQVMLNKATKYLGITTTVRNSLTIAANEYPVIYNTTTGQFERYNGSAWEVWGVESADIDTFAELDALVADETLLYSGGALGTPASGVATNLTGTASGLTAGNVTTNANLTGEVTSVGNVTTIASNAVETTNINDGTITTNDMGVASVNSSAIVNGTIDEADLDTSVNASLDLADSALQSGDVTAATVDAEASADGYVLTSDGAGNAAWEAATGGSGESTTVSDTGEIDLTLTGSDISGALIAGSIDVLKLDSGVQTSLGLADSALQSETYLGDVTKVGTPVDNQVGVWTGDGTLEGDTGLIYDGSLKFVSTGTSSIGLQGTANLSFKPSSGLNYFNTAGLNNSFYVYNYADAGSNYAVFRAYQLEGIYNSVSNYKISANNSPSYIKYPLALGGGTTATEALEVTGNITVSGTVDGIDIATDVAANTAKTTNATHTGDVTGSTALTIADNAVDENMLNAVNVPTDEYVLTYESSSSQFEWQASATTPEDVAYTSAWNGDTDATSKNTIWDAFFVQSDTVGIANSTQITNMFAITQAGYDALTPADDVLYVITDAKTSDVIQIACSDLTTDITTGTSKAYFRMPWAATLTDVKVSLLTAGTTTGLTVDINESGTTVLSTKLTTDATEETSSTAATAAVISDSSIADDAEITIDFDAVPTSGAGVIVTLYFDHD